MRTGGRQAGGFTLIEILMVVTILGIASAMIVPAIGSRDDLKVSAAARVLMSDLIYAQNLAIATQRTVYVKFDAAGGSYALLSALSPSTPLPHPVNGGNFVMRFGTGGSAGLSGVKLTSANLDAQSVLAFDELGSPLAVNAVSQAATALNDGKVKLSSGAQSLTVAIEPFTGEITIQ